MLFFSIKTCDTKRSIANSYSKKKTFDVHLITPCGQVFTEKDYDGYGEFGGKDYYELLAELNGAGQDREMGITIAFKDNPSGDNTPNVIYPKLVEFLDQDVETQYNRLPNPKSCKYQGYFYN